MKKEDHKHHNKQPTVDEERKNNKPQKSTKNKENELKILKCEKEIVEKAKEVLILINFKNN